MTDKVQERLIRVEERLVAERSIRKTRDDQMFKRLESLNGGLEEVSDAQNSMAFHIRELQQTAGLQSESQASLTKSVSENTTVLQRIDGSIKTLKWLWPILLMIFSASVSLFVQNVLQTSTETARVEAKKASSLVVKHK